MHKNYIIAAITAAALIWWILPSQSKEANSAALGTLTGQVDGNSAESNAFESAIQPVSDQLTDAPLSSEKVNSDLQTSNAKATSTSSVEIPNSGSEVAQVSRQFRKAQSLMESANWAEAEQILLGLIDQYPQLVEAYINLASVYSKSDRLELAKQTLRQGIDAVPNFASLFASLQSIHSAMAAKAYAEALYVADENGSRPAAEKPLTVELPVIVQLDTAPVDRKVNQQLASKIADLQQSQNKLHSEGQRQLGEAQFEISRLKKSLIESNQKATDYQQQLSSLSQQTSQSEGALSSVKSQHQQELGRLQQDLAEQEQLVASLTSQVTRERNTVARLQQEVNNLSVVARSVESSQPVVSTSTPAVDRNPPTVAPIKSEPVNTQAQNQPEEDRDIAIQLVRRWAQAWSDQDVESYVNRYISGYTPNPNLTHRQWLAQRQVRLTNKRFIKVGVRDFSVVENADGFSVSFTQHYQSNTMNDTIRKRLSFKGQAGNWQNAKIVGERVL